jgi:hypothetical protein
MRTRVLLFIAVVLALGLTTNVGAVVVYDNTTDGLQFGDFYPNTLDDVNVAGGGPVTLYSMQFGVECFANQNVDAIVTFWSDVDITVPITDFDTVVNTGELTSFRVPLGSLDAGSVQTTAMFNLPTPVSDPDGSLGVQITIVLAGTDTPTYDATPLLLTGEFVAPTVGTTFHAYWGDVNDSGNDFTGDEQYQYGNLYLQLSDTLIPEPSGLGLIGLAGLSLLAMRRRRACA